jgi:hypothetical protein
LENCQAALGKKQALVYNIFQKNDHSKRFLKIFEEKKKKK